MNYSGISFKFENIIPAALGGKEFRFKVHLVESDIPKRMMQGLEERREKEAGMVGATQAPMHEYSSAEGHKVPVARGTPESQLALIVTTVLLSVKTADLVRVCKNL